jgi:hypothetical protein
MPKKRYPDNWWEIAYFMKVNAGFVCERCGHPDDPENGYMLTVHHLDGVPAHCQSANLPVLCQRCHLHVQNIPLYQLANQLEMFEDFEMRWLRPHLEGLGIPVPVREVA